MARPSGWREMPFQGLKQGDLEHQVGAVGLRPRAAVDGLQLREIEVIDKRVDPACSMIRRQLPIEALPRGGVRGPRGRCKPALGLCEAEVHQVRLLCAGGRKSFAQSARFSGATEDPCSPKCIPYRTLKAGRSLYPGANAQTVRDTVAAPIEAQIS